jgi:hypothetical protein
MWKVWLADGTTFDSTQGGPNDVPQLPRVVCVAQKETRTYWGACLTGGDWYMYREDLGCWTEHTDVGALMEFQDHAPDIVACRAGKWIGTDDFKAAWSNAREWLNGQ